MQSFSFNPSFVLHRHYSSSSSVRDATFLMPQPTVGTSASHTTRIPPFANEREVEDPLDEGEPFPVTMALPSSSSQTYRPPVYGQPSRSQTPDDPSLPTTIHKPLEYRTIKNAPDDPTVQQDQFTDAEMRPVPKKRKHTERERYDILQNDPYVMSFTSTDVICSGCGGTIQLDKRGVARYYIHFWSKHKVRCRGVKDGITAAKLHEFEALESY